MRFDLLVFIGRFQPPHRGHLAVIRAALAQAPQVLVLVGSANEAGTARNPFTYAQRRTLIEATLPRGARDRIRIEPLADVPGDDAAWVREVERVVALHAGPGRTGLVGHHKDATAYYLELFPRWEQVEVPNYRGLCATGLRDRLARGAPLPRHAVTAPVRRWLQRHAIAQRAA